MNIFSSNSNSSSNNSRKKNYTDEIKIVYMSDVRLYCIFLSIAWNHLFSTQNNSMLANFIYCILFHKIKILLILLLCCAASDIALQFTLYTQTHTHTRKSLRKINSSFIEYIYTQQAKKVV